MFVLRPFHLRLVMALNCLLMVVTRMMPSPSITFLVEFCCKMALATEGSLGSSPAGVKLLNREFFENSRKEEFPP